MKEALLLNVDHYVNMLLMLHVGHEMNVVVVEHEKKMKNQVEIALLMMHHRHPIQEQVVFLQIQ